MLNIASELESLVNERGLSLSIAVGASLPRVRTDPTHLRQILVNLIGNAVKYTPSGGIAVRARLVGATSAQRVAAARAHAGGSRARAASPRRAPRVDRAAGRRHRRRHRAGDQARIFDEFEQVNAGPRGESMQRGTGLGLAISRRLAQLLGGDIGVESQVGKGSTFTLWLPVHPSRSRSRGDAERADGRRESAGVAQLFFERPKSDAIFAPKPGLSSFGRALRRRRESRRRTRSTSG